MDWENERYVRVYTRDTVDWVALGWEAQSLFLLLIRKVDRAGVLEVGKRGSRGIAALVGMPAEVVERALPVLMEDGCVVLAGGRLVMPNFIQAQEAKQSDRQRQRESRDRRRAESISGSDVTKSHERSQAVTNRDESSRNVTKSHERSQAVTDGHDRSQPVTPSLAEPIRAEPSQDPLARDPGATSTEPAPEEPKVDKPKSAFDWLSYFQASYWQSKGRQYGQGESDAKAQGRLADYLASLPGEQRRADWEARERIVAEFLAKADRDTQAAGWSFAFFVAAFRGLSIPPQQRPKPVSGGRPERLQARY